ncbi:MAG: class I SAM-dependent methyltransferase [Erysipelotrichaceae bacterium]|nr:class I SAM-dependent methyltransferase [Erysipelotrichaceae bacterium]
MEKILQFAHSLIKNHINNDDIFIDMTIGNGKDTLYLCQNCKFVYGFDIQQLALDNTKKLLNNNNLTNYSLHLLSHDLFDEIIDFKVKGFIFNLGYLPCGNKIITTKANTTILALKKALDYLLPKGIIVIVVYPGHEEGKNEKEAILKYVKSLDQRDFDVIVYSFINQINNPPFVIAIERK